MKNYISKNLSKAIYAFTILFIITISFSCKEKLIKKPPKSDKYSVIDTINSRLSILNSKRLYLSNKLNNKPDRVLHYAYLLIDEYEKRNDTSQVLNYYYETCDYCNGRPLSGHEVQPVVQADKPIEYKKYN